MRATEYREPYRHWLVRDVVDAEKLADARAAVPSATHAAWVRYDNELERRKWTMEDRDALPAPWLRVFARLFSPPMTDRLACLTGVPLLNDPCWRGAGLHVMFPGGHLATHVDYALHPSGLERRANLILFLDATDHRYGGGLQLCDPAGRPAKTLYPAVGDAVVWECGDETFHAVEPLAADSPPRVTAAAYYLALPRPGCVRRRALFLPRR
jgi:hypothetical protein